MNPPEGAPSEIQGRLGDGEAVLTVLDHGIGSIPGRARISVA